MTKELLKQRFTKSLKTYQQNAIVQKQMAEKLTQNVLGSNFDDILELGCGTGFVTEILNEHCRFNNYDAIDIVNGCKSFIEKISNNINTGGLRCFKTGKSELVTGIQIAGTFNFFPSTTNIWQKVYSTFKIPPNNDYDRLYAYISSNRDINMYMTDIKLEKGSKPTDWSPAPEDIAHMNGEQLELLS